MDSEIKIMQKQWDRFKELHGELDQLRHFDKILDAVLGEKKEVTKDEEKDEE